MAGGGNLANEEALEFGRYTYRDSGPRAQTFPVQVDILCDFLCTFVVKVLHGCWVLLEFRINLMGI